ncbi:hypothetical protein Tco_1561080 [Tanacetum coccineum]
MVSNTAPLIGSDRKNIIWPMGEIIAYYVENRDAEYIHTRSPYNGIIGRLGVKKIQAVPSTAHGMLKSPVPGGILTLRCCKIIQLECTIVSGSEAQPFAITRAAEERIKVAIHPKYPEQTIAIGSTLTEEGRKELCDLLRRNLDIRLETSGHDWCSAAYSGASAERSGRMSFG